MPSSRPRSRASKSSSAGAAELLGSVGGARNPSYCLQHVQNGDGCPAKADDCI